VPDFMTTPPTAAPNPSIPGCYARTYFSRGNPTARRYVLDDFICVFLDGLSTSASLLELWSIHYPCEPLRVASSAAERYGLVAHCESHWLVGNILANTMGPRPEPRASGTVGVDAFEIFGTSARSTPIFAIKVSQNFRGVVDSLLASPKFGNSLALEEGSLSDEVTADRASLLDQIHRSGRGWPEDR